MYVMTGKAGISLESLVFNIPYCIPSVLVATTGVQSNTQGIDVGVGTSVYPCGTFVQLERGASSSKQPLVRAYGLASRMKVEFQLLFSLCLLGQCPCAQEYMAVLVRTGLIRISSENVGVFWELEWSCTCRNAVCFRIVGRRRMDCGGPQMRHLDCLLPHLGETLWRSLTLKWRKR